MDFGGKTNKDYVMINAITFRLNNGKEVTIDREYTGYDIDEEGNLGMTWKGCYFWDDNIMILITPPILPKKTRKNLPTRNLFP